MVVRLKVPPCTCAYAAVRACLTVAARRADLLSRRVRCSVDTTDATTREVTVGGDVESAQIDMLQHHHAYAITVTSHNNKGVSGHSEPLVYTHVPSTGRPPASVEKVKGRSVLLKWGLPLPAEGVTYTGFELSMQDRSAGSDPELIATLPITQLKYVVTGLKLKTSYRFFIVALNTTLDGARRLDKVAHGGRRLAGGGQTVLDVDTPPSENTEVALDATGESVLSYAANDLVELRWRPASGVNRIDIQFDVFDVECDHDNVTLYNAGVEVWRGGCHRTGPFNFSLQAVADPMEADLVLQSDSSVHGAGVQVKYT